MAIVRTAAITGAAGFLGRHLVRGLAARGARVVPLVRAVEPAAPATGLAPDPSLRSGMPATALALDPSLRSGVPATARALDEVLARPYVLEGLDVLVHAAAVRHRHGVDAAAYRASNVELVERVMRACAGRVRRFVLVGSVGVYGFPARLPITEAHPFAPRTLYGQTKVDAERLARSLAPDLGLELVIVRPTIVYGTGDRNGMLDKMAHMIRAGTYRIVGPGTNVLHHTHVDDMVEGIWLAASRSEAAGEDFILAGPSTITLVELSRLVARAVGRPLPRVHVPLAFARAIATVVDVAAYRGIVFDKREPPINHDKLDVMTVSIAFDPSKARRMIGFAPRVTYEKGIARKLSEEAAA
jgi:UDP-glucose 4-epimerase